MDNDNQIKQSIGNYKGLMLCSRPNDEIKIEMEKPFISRVYPQDQIGLNPVQKLQLNKPQKKINLVLLRHVQWLNNFKQKIQEKKELEENKEIQKITKIHQLRESSITKIQKQKVKYNSQYQSQDQANNIIEQVDQNSKINQFDDLKNNSQQNQMQVEQKVNQNNNKSKPKWAYTEKEIEEQQNKECDELLQFANNLDYDQYVNDLEVKTMIQALKNRINQLNQNPENFSQIDKNIVQNQTNEQEQNDKQQIIAEHQNITDSMIQQQDKQEETRSVKSEKSKQSIKNIKEDHENQQKEKQDWDSSTINKEKTKIEDRLVKHIAEEILRNNKYLRSIHSNQSIRTILELEAKKHIQDKGINLMQQLK